MLQHLVPADLVLWHTATALFLTRGDTDQSWGPSRVLMRHLCWNKSFGQLGTASRNLWSGWGFFYTPTLFYYGTSIVIMVWTVCALSRGLPRTLEIRKRRINDGQKLVTVFTLYLLSGFFLFVTVMYVTDSADTSTGITMKCIFAFWMGARGLPDIVCWRLVVIRSSSVGVGFVETQLIGRSASFIIDSASGLTRALSTRAGLAAPLLESSGGEAGPSGGPVPMPLGTTDEESIELNAALIDEVPCALAAGCGCCCCCCWLLLAAGCCWLLLAAAAGCWFRLPLLHPPCRTMQPAERQRAGALLHAARPPGRRVGPRRHPGRWGSACGPGGRPSAGGRPGGGGEHADRAPVDVKLMGDR